MSPVIGRPHVTASWIVPIQRCSDRLLPRYLPRLRHQRRRGTLPPLRPLNSPSTAANNSMQRLNGYAHEYQIGYGLNLIRYTPAAVPAIISGRMEWCYSQMSLKSLRIFPESRMHAHSRIVGHNPCALPRLRPETQNFPRRARRWEHREFRRTPCSHSSS